MCFASYKPEEIAACIGWKIGEEDGKENKKEGKRKTGVIAALMSGDSGFFSGTGRLLAVLESIWGRAWMAEHIVVLPGISSLSYFSSRIGKSWEDVEIFNLHGSKQSLWPAVLMHERVFAVTGGNIEGQLRQLVEKGLGDTVCGYIGERLSYPDEEINSCSVAELAERSYDGLAVLYLENPNAVGNHLAELPDESFIRGKVPMTKAEVRALVMSKLRLRTGDVVYDIGAGTGSVSVEMALAARKGMVYAIDSNAEVTELCKLNVGKFCLHNMDIVLETAPEVIADLPRPDAAFIGGSKGHMEEIVEVLLQKNPDIRLVIDTVTVENTDRAFALLDSERFRGMEAVQIQVNRAKKAGKSHMMTAENPVTIFSARGSGHIVREGDRS